MNLGKRITALRNYKRLTQEQVAEVLHVKRARYNAWENSISNPDHLMLGAIANLHGVTVDFLLGRPYPGGDVMLTNDLQADGYTEEAFLGDLEKELQRNYKPKTALNAKEERDIAADLERMISELETNEALAFHGEPMDDETKELMKISLENSLRLAKGMAKQKFNPNKNK